MSPGIIKMENPCKINDKWLLNVPRLSLEKPTEGPIQSGGGPFKGAHTRGGSGRDERGPSSQQGFVLIGLGGWLGHFLPSNPHV